MKAFQLKIAIKNSKPPIWRRVIVPAGITFSQLSLILNEVMGWSGYHLSEYEFYHLNLHIAEDADEDFGLFSSYVCIEAKNTYIREYLEENDWFTYIYDFGDWWQHRVTVEKILTDYEYDYPQVIKYKGDCPPEDCGGIWGYYELMDIISDKNHPEYEERMDWLDWIGYSDGYDMNAINEKLKTQYFYKWKKGKNRSQREIQKDIFSGKYGLRATKNDTNAKGHNIRSKEEKIQDIVNMWSDMFRADEVENLEYDWKKLTLADIMEDYEEEDIREIACNKRIKGVSKCSKKVLINKLIKHMLKPEVMESYFSCLLDLEIAVFEKVSASDEPVKVAEEEKVYLSKVYESGYIGMLMDESFIVSKEFAEAYEQIKNAEFDQKRKKISWLRCCLEASVLLYGIVPYDLFNRLLKINAGMSMTLAEIEEAIKNFPPEFAQYIVAEDKIYYKEIYPNAGAFLKEQGNKAYYIPTKQEIENIAVSGQVSDKKCINELKEFLMRNMEIEAYEVDIFSKMIQMDMVSGRKITEIFVDLVDAQIGVANAKSENELLRCLCNLWNNTRLVGNRGFTPKELGIAISFADVLSELDALFNKKSAIIDFDAARAKKVYKN